MFMNKKWLGVLIAIALAGVASLSIAAAPQQQIDQARPPVHFGAVAMPIDKVNPGRGSSSTSVVYTPANIQGAYNFGAFANGGGGKAIAIVDAYGDPTLSADIAAFISQFGLAPVTIHIYTPDGAPTSVNRNWAIETALDVEWAHANAQAATIDLIVVPTASFQSLLDGINYAINNLNVAAISMSWGAPEIYVSSGVKAAYESAFTAAINKGIVLLGASGDQGATDGTSQLTVDYPSSSPQVVGVGGTTLRLNSSGGYYYYVKLR